MTESEKRKPIMYRASSDVSEVLSYVASNAPSVSSQNALVDSAVRAYLNSDVGQSLLAEAQAARAAQDEAIRKLSGG